MSHLVLECAEALKAKCLMRDRIVLGEFGIVSVAQARNEAKRILGLVALPNFISVDTDFKYKGLINVSGFHINPGSSGRTHFTVYNAGPRTITLRYLEPAFHVWFTTVEHNYYEGNECNVELTQLNIDSKKITDINGQIYSPHVLSDRIQHLEVIGAKNIYWLWVH